MHKASIKTLNHDNETALHLAALSGNFGGTKALLLVGAKINAVDKHVTLFKCLN
jgi:ankyrin repeat protein